MKGRFPNIQYDSNFFTYHVFIISLETNTGTPEPSNCSLLLSRRTSLDCYNSQCKYYYLNICIIYYLFFTIS